MTPPASGPIAQAWAPQSASAPPVVWAGVVTTWCTAGATAVLTAVLAVGFIFVGAPLADAFAIPHWWLWILAIEGATLACCVIAAMLARGVLRGSNAARWGLLGSSAITALVGAMAAYYIWPALVAIAAVVVMVLLLLPGTRQWTRVAAS